MWVDVHGLVWRSDRRIWRRPWSWHVWCRTADGQQHHRAGRTWSRREAKRQELLAWGELFLQVNSHTARSNTLISREVALPSEAMNALTALQQWRNGHISGLDLIDIYDQAEAAIRNLLPAPEEITRLRERQESID